MYPHPIVYPHTPRAAAYAAVLEEPQPALTPSAQTEETRIAVSVREHFAALFENNELYYPIN